MIFRKIKLLFYLKIDFELSKYLIFIGSFENLSDTVLKAGLWVESATFHYNLTRTLIRTHTQEIDDEIYHNDRSDHLSCLIIKF